MDAFDEEFVLVEAAAVVERQHRDGLAVDAAGWLTAC